MNTQPSSSKLSAEEIASRVEQNLDKHIGRLAELVAFPSLAFDGYDPQPNIECGKHVLNLAKKIGFKDAELLEVGPGFPSVWATHHVDDSLPTVLMYAHYDVQPAPVKDQGWESDPFTLTKKDGRLYGRGAADNKSGIISHFAAIKALGGLENIDNFNIKLCIEGEEEAHGHLAEFVPTEPKRFHADIYMVCDSGNLELGRPGLLTSLRGAAVVHVTLRTIDQALHSGIFGGAAPDAFLAATKLVQSCFDEDGNTAIPGLKTGEWEGAKYPEELLREQLGLRPGVELAGTGPIASRLWSRPSLSITGIDALPMKDSSAIIIPEVTLSFALRYPASNKPQEALQALKNHLIKNVPYNAEITFSNEIAVPGLSKDLEGEHAELAKVAFEEAFGYPTTEIGCGASIPLVDELAKLNPEATVLVYGAEDTQFSKIHGGNESVEIEELRKTILAEALFLSRV